MSAPGSGTGAGVDGDAGAVRRRQLVLFSVIAAVVLVVLAVWLTAGGGGQPAVQGGIEAELAGPDTAEKVWTRRSRGKDRDHRDAAPGDGDRSAASRQ